MKFDFIPYKLNTPFDELKEKLEYISNDNGVDFYTVGKLPTTSIFGVKVAKIALYFFEGSLIAVYIQLAEIFSNWEKVVREFEKQLKKKSMAWEVDTGWSYNWETENDFLGILANKESNNISLYYTLKEYNILEE